jgi:hypothetical protein
MSTDNSALRVVQLYGDWHVVGGNLPAGASWAMFDTEAEAFTEAHEIAADMCLEVQS